MAITSTITVSTVSGAELTLQEGDTIRGFYNGKEREGIITVVGERVSDGTPYMTIKHPHDGVKEYSRMTQPDGGFERLELVPLKRVSDPHRFVDNEHAAIDPDNVGGWFFPESVRRSW